jgi:hypothetical protein
MRAGIDDVAFRESAFAWLRARMLVTDGLTREQLSQFEFAGRRHRLVGTMTGIWRVKDYSDAAISILTAYVDDESKRPYDDTIGPDGMLRYKWRGTNPSQADNMWLRTAMERRLPLVWFIGIGRQPGTRVQVFRPEFPVWLVAEEPDHHQFVVEVDQAQRLIPAGADAEVIDITKRYNERIVRERIHQPVFRSVVLHAYERRCAVLPKQMSVQLQSSTTGINEIELGDDLHGEVAHELAGPSCHQLSRMRLEARQRIAARIRSSTFSIFAFEALRRELEQVDELQFIFTSPTFVKAEATDHLPKARREFFIPHGRNGESTLYGSDFEIRLRNKLTQRAIARECADWVRRKVRFRSNKTGAPMQQFAIVDDRLRTCRSTGSRPPTWVTSEATPSRTW